MVKKILIAVAIVVKKILIAVAIIVLLLFSYNIFTNTTVYWSDDEISENIVVAEQIIKQIEKYKNEKKNYPKSLEELVPGYLSEIQKSKLGKWVYNVHIDQG